MLTLPMKQDIWFILNILAALSFVLYYATVRAPTGVDKKYDIHNNEELFWHEQIDEKEDKVISKVTDAVQREDEVHLEKEKEMLYEKIVYIPRRVVNEDSHRRLMSMESVALKDYPALIEFFKWFRFEEEVNSPWSDLNKFLNQLRSSNINMFVAPIEAFPVYIKTKKEHDTETKHAAVKVNVVWESFNSKKSIVHAALGDVAFVDFKISNDKQILDWAFDYLKDPPPILPVKRDLVSIASNKSPNDRKIEGYPTFYLDCFYSGSSVYFGKGFYDYPWLQYLQLITVSPNTQNGVTSFSSMDLTGNWGARMWNNHSWSGSSELFHAERESCFTEELGWLNDRIRSLEIFSL